MRAADPGTFFVFGVARARGRASIEAPVTVEERMGVDGIGRRASGAEGCNELATIRGSGPDAGTGIGADSNQMD